MESLRATIAYQEDPCCQVCSYPLSHTSVCKWEKYHPRFVKRIYAISMYQDTSSLHRSGKSDLLSQTIYYLKRNMKKAEPLGLAIAESIKNRYPELMGYDCISFVPQASNELKKDEKTGEAYDQAELLARWVNKGLNIPLVNSITKTRAHSMHDLRLSKRREAVKDLYVCTSDKIRSKRVLLVDDVATTSADLDKCAEELLKAEANEISAFVCGIQDTEFIH